MRCLILIAAAALLANAPAAQGSMITIDASSSSVTSHILNGDGSMSLSLTNSTLSIPISTSVSISDEGVPPTSSATTINFSNTPEQTVLGFGFNHLRTGAVGQRAQSFGALTFTATSNAAFTLSGFYNLTGMNEIAFQVNLDDNGIAGGGEPLPPKEKGEPGVPSPLSIQHYHASDDTLNEHFELGGPTGDGLLKKLAVKVGTTNDLTGILLAGHTYSFSFNAYILSNNWDETKQGILYTGDAGASAVGGLTLTIDQVTSTPEPASFALLGFASLCGVGLRLRRRSASSNAA